MGLYNPYKKKIIINAESHSLEDSVLSYFLP